MSFCFYCGGGDVSAGRCAKCYRVQPGIHRKYVDETDAGFTERFIKLGMLLIIIYFVLIIFYKSTVSLLQILNR